MDPNYFMNFDSLRETVEIKVIWQGAMGALVVPFSARIIEVKLLILQTLNVPIAAERQELSWEGHNNIPANATIHVFNKIKVGVYLATNRLYHEIVVYEGTSVGELKAKIHADYGVNIDHKVLCKGNDDLDDRTIL
ncbi:hypothetical protein DVH24_042158 [Malus domestica]|uniref:Ubiquitin-like domain-containing protein n=1 Tax=Malus domestica TaxID=3750 RepID=A0A498J0M3_MALDO|nr:hypothetical protein DVH24_042158 [Malus domestica]